MEITSKGNHTSVTASYLWMSLLKQELSISLLINIVETLDDFSVT